MRQFDNGRVGLQAGGDALVKHKYERGLDDGKEANMPKPRDEDEELIGKAGGGEVRPPGGTWGVFV